MKLITSILILFLSLKGFTQNTFFEIDADGNPIEVLAITVDQWNNLLDRINTLEANIEIVPDAIDGIDVTLANNIENDLLRLKTTTISNKYREDDLVGYAIFKVWLKKDEDAIEDFKQAYTVSEMIDKFKTLLKSE